MRVALTLLVLTAVLGCEATLQQFKNLKASPASEYIRRANEHEQASRFQEALLTWRIAAELDNGNDAITGNIQRLEQQVARQAQDHFQKGLAFLQSGNRQAARHEFIKVLLADPQHSQALRMIQSRLQEPQRTVYKVQPGDSFSKIALTQYNDPTKALMIADFNDLDARRPLRIGTVLMLPKLEKRYILPRSDMEQLLDKARKALAEKQYARAVSIAEKIIGEVPGHPQARSLAQRARLDHALELKASGRYNEALALLEQTPPGQKGRRQAMAEIRGLISQQTLAERMAAARKQMESGNHNAVMAIAEAILDDHPDHAQAKALRNEAGYIIGKSLIEQERMNEAVVWLEKVDADYADTARQLSMARSRNKAAAEEHYRDGVKHFINEDLEAAIREWQRALNLNPEHPKARQDMEDALRLLEKWRKLDNPPEGADPQ